MQNSIGNGKNRIGKQHNKIPNLILAGITPQICFSLATAKWDDGVRNTALIIGREKAGPLPAYIDCSHPSFSWISRFRQTFRKPFKIGPNIIKANNERLKWCKKKSHSNDDSFEIFHRLGKRHLSKLDAMETCHVNNST